MHIVKTVIVDSPSIRSQCLWWGEPVESAEHNERVDNHLSQSNQATLKPKGHSMESFPVSALT